MTVNLALKQMKPVILSSKTYELQDYGDVGKHSFEPKILDGVVIPSLGYPSFSYLNVTEIDFDEKYVGKTCFNIVLVRIPPCEADYTPE